MSITRNTEKDGGGPAAIVQLLPPVEEAEESLWVAIALGLRFTVPDCVGAMVAFACVGSPNSGMFLVHESDLEVRDGTTWILCEPCDSPHEVLSLVEALRNHWIGAASGSARDLLVSVDHEQLLLAELDLRCRALESRHV